MYPVIQFLWGIIIIYYSMGAVMITNIKWNLEMKMTLMRFSFWVFWVLFLFSFIWDIKLDFRCPKPNAAI